MEYDDAKWDCVTKSSNFHFYQFESFEVTKVFCSK